MKTIIIEKRIHFLLNVFKKVEPKEDELEIFIKLLSDTIELISRFSSDECIKYIVQNGTHLLEYEDILERLWEFHDEFEVQDSKESFDREAEIAAETSDWECLEKNWKDVEKQYLEIHGTIDQTILNRKLYSLKNQFDYLKQLHLKDQKAIEIKGDNAKIEIPLFEIEFLEQLGETCFAKTYQAKWGQKIVAIKALNLSHFSPKTIHAYEKDLEIIRKLSCGHLESLYGIVYEPRNFAFVTEFAAKGSLYDLLNMDKDVPWSLRKQIADDIAKGMEYLYQIPLVHGNLKSQNILLDSEYHVKISGFGFRELRFESYLKQNIPSQFSIRWTAPELFDNVNIINEKSDVYSYSMVLSEIISRKVPFSDILNELLLIPRIQNGVRPELPEKDITPELLTVVKKCWASDPKRRPTFHQIILRDFETESEDAQIAEISDHLKQANISKKKREKENEQNYKLACQYFEGKNTQKNLKKAAKLFRLAAEQGHVPSISKLGRIYYFGEGVEKDPKDAIKWWSQSADKGDAYSQYNLGVCFMKGIGVEKNPKIAVLWYRLAAEQNHLDAQVNLGVSYYEGDGIEKNFVEAAFWWKKAAEAGNSDAQCNLGDLYFEGEGVVKSYPEAVKWYQRAAEQQDVSAQINLCNCYRFGYGVTKNIDTAITWCQMAADQGDEEATALLKKLKKVDETKGS